MWAADRFLQAVSDGSALTPNIWRSLATLPYESWVHFDTEVVREYLLRTPLATALANAGLVKPIPNALAKTVFVINKLANAGAPAVQSLDGFAADDALDHDRPKYVPGFGTLPVTLSMFDLNIRQLKASTLAGEALDTIGAETSARAVGEAIESSFFLGIPAYDNKPMYGLKTHPNRITASYVNVPWSDGSVTGANVLADVKAGIAALHAKRMHGPYWLVMGGTFEAALVDDFKAASDKSIMARLLEVPGLQRVVVSDMCPADEMFLIQADKTTVQLGDGIAPQTVQWDTRGGWLVTFGVFAIQVPLIIGDAGDRLGVVHYA